MTVFLCLCVSFSKVFRQSAFLIKFPKKENLKNLKIFISLVNITTLNLSVQESNDDLIYLWIIDIVT